MNTLNIIGRLTKNVEFVRKGENLVAKGCIASNKKFKKGDKIWQDTIYLNFLIYGKLAEFASEHCEKLAKSKAVHLCGALSQRHYTDGKGAKSIAMQIIVDAISFLEQGHCSDEGLNQCENETARHLESENLTDEQMADLYDEVQADLIYHYDLNGKIIGATSNEKDEDKEELPFL